MAVSGRAGKQRATGRIDFVAMMQQSRKSTPHRSVATVFIAVLSRI
jgi:hypothetical protein